jgi:hypothetical protein
MKVAESAVFVSGGSARPPSSAVWALVIRGVCRSIELASEVCGATPFDDDGMGLAEPCGAAPAHFILAQRHVDWASLTGFDRGRLAREVLPSGHPST